MISIALITTELSYQLMKPVLDRFEGDCRIVPFINTRSGDIEDRRRDDYSGFDGILFSGWLNYAIVSSVLSIDKPFEVITPSAGDYYRTLLKALLEHPEVELEQILTDRIGNGQDFADVFPAGRSCRYIDTDRILAAKDMELDLPAIAERISLFEEACIKSIEENGIRMVISGISTMKAAVEEKGAYFYHIFPDAYSISGHIQTLINRIKSGNQTGSLFVNGLLACLGNDPELMEKIISGFVVRNGIDSISEREDSVFRISIPYMEFQRITENQTDCLLSRELMNRGVYTFSLGWGLGYDQRDAGKAAQKALNISRHSALGTSFIVTEKNMVIGPMLGKSRLFFNADNDESTLAMSYAYDISQLHIKRILALIEHTHNNLFSGDSLSAALNISSRSARRILAKLAENGGAELVAEEERTGRGRPKLYYRITMI